MFNRSLAVFLITFLGASVESAAQTQAAKPDAAVRDIAGCYELSVGAWSPADPNSAYHRIPLLVQLDTLPATHGRGWVLTPSIAYPYHSAIPGTPRWSLAADTLRFLWSNGFQVTTVALERRDSLWTGEAVAESDAVLPPTVPLPRARVSAHRTLCR